MSYFDYNNISAAAVVAAGGSSARMDGANKLFAPLCGKPVLAHSLIALQKSRSVSEIIISSREEDFEKIGLICEEYNITKLKKIVKGGISRAGSVKSALYEVSETCKLVAVHDGARPLVSVRKINLVIAAAAENDAAILAVPVKDTVKIVNNKFIESTPERDSLWLAQTPQVFSVGKYKEIIKNLENNKLYTDDSSYFENSEINSGVKIIEGDYDNIKITTPEDLLIAEALLLKKSGYNHENKIIKIGHGYDAHKFADNRELVLCGVIIPHDRGLLGHSDADVATHALMDAILGAMALGDIGRHFPDNDISYKNANSLTLLSRVINMISEKNFAIGNADITIIAEKPKLAPYIGKMRKNLSDVCDIPIENINVKATTEEGLGMSGRGIASHAVCTLFKFI